MQIINGKLKNGDKLFSKNFFIQKFKVNPKYLTSAYDQMIKEEIIEAREDNYYIICDDDKINIMIEQFASDYCDDFFENMNKLGFDELDSFSFLRTRLNANG
ncbi:MAG: hypothetical protein SOZ89_04680 [Peptoniphilaceae bacterium]|nr:hypothetical protein [Peptoniphilaceae bacterium]MDD7383177.1 hypothetical protein [Peptoniphilaceae bacterium]MDY3738401.1 hypothetical protein [Peptoniphilaceae bacterium]